MAVYAFTVEATDPRDRLDKLIVALLARAGMRQSRAVIGRSIDHGRVRVDGQPLRAARRVAPGARIEVDPEPPPLSSAEPDNSIRVDIVYEDEHLLVVDKPAGLVVHPARGHHQGTLVNGLLAHGGFEHASADPRDPEGHLRPGIVHRLDKGTSGLLVVAKHERAREGLKLLFARHTIEREYIAIVVGHGEDRTIDTLYARDGVRFTSRVSEGRRALTRVCVLERFDVAAKRRDSGEATRLGSEATLVVCQLATGRTHQIRVHLTEHLGTPILGDRLYGRPPRAPLLAALADELGHPALHARVLGFDHPITGNAMHFERPAPADFAACLDRLRGPR